MAARPAYQSSNDGLTFMFEHCSARPSCPELSSGTASPAPSSSPATPTDQLQTCPLGAAAAAEDSWNLIPYDVPWGPEYYHYKAGTLPGPDGACIFLRSPTPLKNRRTQKACNKCRQRKAKCSGTRPTCSRCLARGYICEYVEEEKDKRPAHDHGRSRESRQRRVPSEDPSDDAEYSSAEGDDYPSPHAPQPYAPRPLKLEESEFSTPDLLYPDSASTSDSASPSAEYCSPWDDAPYHPEAPYGYPSPAHSFGEHNVGDYYDSSSYAVDPEMQPFQSQHMSSVYYHQEVSQHPAAVHAPRPVRCTSSPSFLSPQQHAAHFPSSCEEQMFQHDDMLIDLNTAVDPAPQIAIPQLPLIGSADGTNGPAHGAHVEFAHPQAMYHWPASMPQYPLLQYQYAVPTYISAPQDNVEPAMLYTMVATGMAS